jgi:hypothetical protein
MRVGLERRISRGFVAILIACGGLAGPAPEAWAQDPEEYSCGPTHQRDVQDILRLRDPGARSNSADLSLDRALVITDFLRLRAEGNGGAAATLRGIDEASLRRARDGGYVTPEVCAVVRFMHGYYARGKQAPDARAREVPPEIQPERTPEPAPERARVARRPSRQEPLPDVAAAAPPERAQEPIAAPPRPEPAAQAPATPRREAEPEPKRSPRAPRPPPDRGTATAKATSPAPPPTQPAPAEPVAPAQADAEQAVLVAAIENERAALERRESEADAEVRRAALVLIAEMEAQLNVPAYLSFRETRTEARKLSEEEIEARQAASLRATDRVQAILTRLSLEPVLREAVHASLGVEGRARIEGGIQRQLKNLPDEAQRNRTLTLWSELEAAAPQKR